MRQRFQIVVVGAGMVGLTAAAKLARSRHADRLEVIVADAGPRPHYDAEQDFGLRVSALSPGTVAIFNQLGAWQPIAAGRVCPFRRMRVWDARSAPEASDALDFDAADFALTELGFIAENDLIRDALLSVVEDARIDLRFSQPVARIEHDDSARAYRLQLEGGESLSPDLLLGADGAGSAVRQAANIDVRSWQYPQTAFVTHVRPERPHGDVAWQRFLQDGPIALLPLADGRSSIVWSTTPTQAAAATAADDADLGEMLTDATDHALGRLIVDGPRASFSLRAQHANHYVRPGLALLGDAAHSVHPLAGQGANLGFADADALAQAVLDAIDRNEHPGDLPTLRRYERARRGENTAMLRFIDTINRFFLLNDGPFPTLRRRGMRLFNRSGPLRRRAVAVALGVEV